MAYFIIAVIAVLVLFWVITPLFLKTPVKAPVDVATSAAALRGEDLTELRDTLLRNLKDLEFDRSMGKINEDEYAVLRAQMTAQVSKVLDQIERGANRTQATAFAGASGPVFSSAADVSLELEVLVARVRRQLPKNAVSK